MLERPLQAPARGSSAHSFSVSTASSSRRPRAPPRRRGSGNAPPCYFAGPLAAPATSSSNSFVKVEGSNSALGIYFQRIALVMPSGAIRCIVTLCSEKAAGWPCFSGCGNDAGEQLQAVAERSGVATDHKGAGNPGGEPALMQHDFEFAVPLRGHRPADIGAGAISQIEDRATCRRAGSPRPPPSDSANPRFSDSSVG